MSHLWPREKTAEARSIKSKVLLSAGLVLAKGLAIQVPFLFKDLIDTLGVTTSTLLDSPLAVVPIATVLGYGIARFSASASSELGNAIFATVAQKTIRTVAIRIFKHLRARTPIPLGATDWRVGASPRSRVSIY